MRNADWVKTWISDKIRQMDDETVMELITQCTDGKTCGFCGILYGECPETHDGTICDERLKDWCGQEREEDLCYRRVTGIYRYDEKEKIYCGVTVDGTGERLIPFHGNSLYELDSAFRSRVDRYSDDTIEEDKELRKLEGLPNIRVLKEGEITGIIAKDNGGICHMTLVFRGNVEVAECRDMTVAFDYFHDFVKEKTAEVMKYDTI